MNTNCEKCLFADYADSAEPCKLDILTQIQNYHKTKVSKNNFYIIENYGCRYGFDIDSYQKNKETIGSITNLTEQLEKRAKIKYYLVIKVTNEDLISNVCDSILSLSIKPRFVSFILYKSNNTKQIISDIQSKLDNIIEWKIHNFLEDQNLNDSISNIFDTNANKKDTIYFWINEDITNSLWNQEIININKIIYLYQPQCHGLFRNSKKDGIFLSFRLYKDMKTHLSSDIFKAFTLLEDPKFIYYA